MVIIVVITRKSFRENPRPHTRAPPPNREVRLAYGPTLDPFPVVVWRLQRYEIRHEKRSYIRLIVRLI